MQSAQRNTGRVPVSRGTPNQVNSKKKSNKNSSKKRKNNNRKNRVIRPQVHFSKCALDYAHALFDPFGAYYTQAAPCIPDLFDLPSKKFSTLTRGSFRTGTQSFGYVAFNPYAWGNGIQGVHTTGDYTGTTVVNTGTGIETISNSQFPYPAGGPFPDIRLVAGGVRVRYIGKLLDMNGRVVPLSDTSTNANFLTRDFGLLASRQDAQIFPVDRRYRGTFVRPSTPTQMEYSNVSGTTANLQLGCFISAEADSAFEYEACFFYEAVPSQLVTVDSTTASHSDVTGMSFIRDFVGGISSSQGGQALYKSFLDRAGSVAWDSMTSLTSGATIMAAQRANSYFSAQDLHRLQYDGVL